MEQREQTSGARNHNDNAVQPGCCDAQGHFKASSHLPKTAISVARRVKLKQSTQIQVIDYFPVLVDDTCKFTGTRYGVSYCGGSSFDIF